MNTYYEKKAEKRIVIIGGGFAGLELSKKLRNSKYEVVLIDKHNYHTFQPLLYQVATGGLRVDSIAYPLRKVFQKSANIKFMMDEVSDIKVEEGFVETTSGKVSFDYLVIATGSKTNFFNFASTSHLLMPLKNPQDALRMRAYVLQNLEKAIKESSESEREMLLNIAIAGGGPTGVELAGALAEMRKYVFPKNYPGLDLSKMRICLYEAGPKLLGPMSDQASAKSLQYLQGFGVEVFLGTPVKSYDGSMLIDGNDEKLKTVTLIWTAGVKGNYPEGLDLNASGPGNRLIVDSYNKVRGYNNVFAIGDAALLQDEENPKGFPMLATVAIQQAKNLAKNLFNIQKNEALLPFKYFDKGTMATIGRNRAVVDLPFWRFQGVFAWYVWIFVHIFSIVGFKNKLSALWDWAYNFFTYDRAVQLIINPFSRPAKDSFDEKNISETERIS